MKISFCTTCMNRLFHLRRTLPHNLRVAADSEFDVELVLIDYGGSDGLEGWITRRCRDALNSGLLRAYRTDEPREFRMAHAKNVAHRLAVGEVLCNLDADQFLTSSYLLHVADAFRQERPCFVRGQLSARGRVTMRREHFFAAGGYDESFDGWGCEDLDLCRRAQRLANLEERVTPRSVVRLIRHGDDIRMANMKEKDKQASHARGAGRLFSNLRSGRLQANRDHSWGETNVRRILPRVKFMKTRPRNVPRSASVASDLDDRVGRLLQAAIDAEELSTIVEISASDSPLLRRTVHAFRPEAEAASLLAELRVKPEGSVDLVVLHDASVSELADATRESIAKEILRVSPRLCLVYRCSGARAREHSERLRSRYGFAREPDWLIRMKSGRRGRSQLQVEWRSRSLTPAIERRGERKAPAEVAVARCIDDWDLKGIEVIGPESRAAAGRADRRNPG